MNAAYAQLEHARPRRFVAWVVALGLGLMAAPLAAQRVGGYEPGKAPVRNVLPDEVKDLDIIERLGEPLPLDITVTTSDGQSRRFGDLLQPGKPVIFAIGYFDCPIACPALMDAMVRATRDLPYRLGADYLMIFLSFDPTNTPEMAKQHEAVMLAGYGHDRETAVTGLHLLCASADSSRAIADAMGWQYRYIPDADEYAHPSGLVILTPEGKVSRYFYGFDYPATPLRLSLLEATEGRISSSIGDKILMFCFNFDSMRGTYTFAAFRVMQAGAVVTAVLLALLVTGLKLMELKRRRSVRAAANREIYDVTDRAEKRAESRVLSSESMHAAPGTGGQASSGTQHSALSTQHPAPAGEPPVALSTRRLTPAMAGRES